MSGKTFSTLVLAGLIFTAPLTVLAGSANSDTGDSNRAPNALGSGSDVNPAHSSNTFNDNESSSRSAGAGNASQANESTPTSSTKKPTGAKDEGTSSEGASNSSSAGGANDGGGGG